MGQPIDTQPRSMGSQTAVLGLFAKMGMMRARISVLEGENAEQKERIAELEAMNVRAGAIHAENELHKRMIEMHLKGLQNYDTIISELKRRNAELEAERDTIPY